MYQSGDSQELKLREAEQRCDCQSPSEKWSAKVHLLGGGGEGDGVIWFTVSLFKQTVFEIYKIFFLQNTLDFSWYKLIFRSIRIQKYTYIQSLIEEASKVT